MRWTCSLLLVSALCGCAEKPAKPGTEKRSYLARAIESEVLVIPLEVEGDQLPERFRRIQGTASRDNQSLIEAVYTCPNSLVWIDRTVDHWGAIIVPSENSSVWGQEPRQTNEEVIDCIRSRTSERFFVAISPNGFDTRDLMIIDKPPSGLSQ